MSDDIVFDEYVPEKSGRRFGFLAVATAVLVSAVISSCSVWILCRRQPSISAEVDWRANVIREVPAKPVEKCFEGANHLKGVLSNLGYEFNVNQGADGSALMTARNNSFGAWRDFTIELDYGREGKLKRLVLGFFPTSFEHDHFKRVFSEINFAIIKDDRERREACMWFVLAMSSRYSMLKLFQDTEPLLDGAKEEFLLKSSEVFSTSSGTIYLRGMPGVGITNMTLIYEPGLL